MAPTRRSDADNAPEAKKAKTDSGSVSIQEGDSLPDIEVTIQSEDTINLAEKFGKGPLVIFSYPKASTPGCTRQTSGYGSLYEKFQELGAAVFGLSADSPKAQTTFKEKTKVEFDLISDPNFELLSVLGAQKPPKSVIRSHFVFMDGKAVLLERSVKPDESPKATLKKVEELVGEGKSSKSGENSKAESNGKAKSNGKATEKENDAEVDSEEGLDDDEVDDDEADAEADGSELDGDSQDEFDSQELDEFGEENDLEEGEEDAEEIDVENDLAEEGVASGVGDDDEEGEEEGEVREKEAQEEDEDEGQEEIDDAKADAKPDAAEANDE